MKYALCSLLLSSALSLNANTAPSYTVIEDKNPLQILSKSLENVKTAKLRLENGLEVYLISDPECEQSAAAFVVKTGSWDDPAEYPGTAHFCEHLLFMGSEKYPKEKGYFEYILGNQGTLNAYTAPDHTNYMFSINNDAFPKALDMLAHFFIDPLFRSSGIERELNAVDQEHAKNIENDGWRCYQVFKETGNQNHPQAKFSTGTAETLGVIPRETLINWYKSHYTANNSKLVVYASMPLDELTKLVATDFSAVKSGVVGERHLDSFLSEQQKGHITFIEPVKKLKQLSLQWEMPLTIAEDNKAKACTLIGYALSYRGQHSLFRVLKNEGLIDNLSAKAERFGPKSLFFDISFTLTDAGVAQYQRVVDATFQAIKRLQKDGMPEYIFDDIAKGQNYAYAFQTRQTPFDFVQGNTAKLIYESLESFPFHTVVPSTYNPTMISLALDTFTPKNCYLSLIAPESLTHVKPEQTEKWMGVKYTIKPLSEKRLDTLNTIALNPNITIPSRNPFMPHHLSIAEKGSTDQEITLLSNTEKGEAYYFEDVQNESPHVAFIVSVLSPEINETAKSAVLGSIFTKALQDQLAAYAFYANNAGLSIGLGFEDLKMTLTLNGYSEKAETYLDIALHALKTTKSNEAQFNLYKEALITAYANQAKSLPYLQAFQYSKELMTNCTPSPYDAIDALQNLSYADFVSYTDTLFNTCYLEGVFTGNITASDATNTWKKVVSTFDGKPFPKANQKHMQCRVLPESKGPFSVKKEIAMQGHVTLLTIQEGAFTHPKKAACDILGSVLGSEFFDVLRTKQQIGYIAKSWHQEQDDILSQLFLVQSSTHSSSDMLTRFDLFLEELLREFDTYLPEEKFEQIRAGKIALLQKPPRNTSERAMQVNLLAFTYHELDRIEKRIKALEELTYEDVKTTAFKMFSKENTRRLALLIEGEQEEKGTFEYKNTTSLELEEVSSFNSWR